MSGSERLSGLPILPCLATRGRSSAFRGRVDAANLRDIDFVEAGEARRFKLDIEFTRFCTSTRIDSTPSSTDLVSLCSFMNLEAQPPHGRLPSHLVFLARQRSQLAQRATAGRRLPSSGGAAASGGCIFSFHGFQRYFVRSSWILRLGIGVERPQTPPAAEWPLPVLLDSRMSSVLRFNQR